MIKSLQSYFKYRGWKVSANKPSNKTATSKLSIELWNNCLSPTVSMADAITWVALKKDEIEKNKK